MSDEEENQVQIRLKGKALETVQRIQAKTGAPNSIDVIRNAIAFYDAAQSYKDDSGAVVLQNPKKADEKVKVLLPT